MDAIFNLDILKSQKIEKIVIETYEGRIKKLKSKTFSGQLVKSDLTEMKYDNLLAKEKNSILGKLNCDEQVKISKNSWILNSKNNIEIIDILKKSEAFYVTHKNKKMYLIEEIVVLDIEKEKIEFKRENRKYKFNINGIVFEVRDKNDFVVLEEKTIILYLNSLIIINFRMSKNIGSCENSIWKKEIDYEYVRKIEKVDVEANLYIEFKEESIVGKIIFLYNNEQVNPEETSEIIGVHNKYYRNLIKEKEIIDRLIEDNWKYIKKGKFIKLGLNQIDIENLRKNKINVFIKETKKSVVGAKFDISIENDIDWFDLDIEIRVDKQVYKGYEFLKKYRYQDYIEINDKIVIIPTEIKEILKIADESFRVNKGYIGDILLLKDIKEKDFFKFENIEIESENLVNIDLRKYQKDGMKWIKYMYLNRIGACLADDMGMGKTIQAIGFISEKKFEVNQKKVLIIAPKSLLINWKREINKVNEKIEVGLYYGNKRFNENIHNGVTITTFHTLVNDFEKFSMLYFDVVIIDEIQYLKNSKTKIYRYINKIKAAFILGLSGTPFENNVMEVMAIMNLLNKGIFKNDKKTLKKYSDDLQLLNKKIKPYFLRRLKKDFLDELPEKIEENIYVEMDESQKKLYDVIKLEVHNELYQNSRYIVKNSGVILSGLLKLRQLCCHPQLLKYQYKKNYKESPEKFEEMKRIVKNIIDNNEKVIVFSSFTSMLEIIRTWALKQEYKVYLIDGKSNNRQQIIDMFENDKKAICLISMKAGGTGLNMVSCKYAIIYDLWWNPAVINQAEDRIYRIGQKREVVIYKLITIDSIEEKILKLNQSKKAIGEEIFNGETKPEFLKLVKEIIE